MDIKRLMSQMQNIQSQVEKIEVQAAAGAEDAGVIVKMNGKFKLVDIKITFVATSAEDNEILEAMIQKAFNDCANQIEATIKKMTGGMM